MPEVGKEIGHQYHTGGSPCGSVEDPPERFSGSDKIRFGVLQGDYHQTETTAETAGRLQLWRTSSNDRDHGRNVAGSPGTRKERGKYFIGTAEYEKVLAAVGVINLGFLT